jgi:hypothetical protein
MLTNVDNIIAGAGTIGNNSYPGYYITLVNGKAGIIDANGTNYQLQIYCYTITNSGLLEATGPAGLKLYGSVANTGRIYAGPNSLVNLSYVDNTGGGVIYAAPNSVITLGSVAGGTLEGSGTFAVQDGTTASLQGTINDLGTITLQTGDPTILAMNTWYKYSSGRSTLINPTLTGGGNIVLSGPNSQITGYGTFVNAGITVSGQGIIGGGANLVLNNQTKGLIDPNSDSPLIVDTGTKTIINSGTMRADFVGELLTHLLQCDLLSN